MEIVICNSSTEVAVKAYETFIKYLKKVEDPVIGFATGSSPKGLYEKFIKEYNKGNFSFKGYMSFNLDEYIGINRHDKNSYYTFMKENLFDHIDIDPANTHIPNGAAENIQDECKHYEQMLSDHRIDIQILGIGSNGHIAFNEPKTPLNKGVHIVDLDQKTINDNSRFFDSIEDVPTQAITMGPKNIMHAKKIILIASGENKAQAIRDMIYGDVTTNVPASILQLHRHVTLIIDTDAAKLI